MEYNVEAVSANVWNEGLENCLAEAYVRFCEENGAAVYAGVLYRTAGNLLDIPMKHGENEALWAQPIAQCLQDDMGMSIEYIEKWKLIEWISAYLNADEPGPEEELTERPASDPADGSTAAVEGAYHFVEPVNESASTDQ